MAVVPLKIVSTLVVLLVVGKFFVVPQVRSVRRSAGRPWLGLAGIALIGVAFAGVAAMPIIADFRHVDTVLMVLVVVVVVGAASVLFAGKQSRRGPGA